MPDFLINPDAKGASHLPEFNVPTEDVEGTLWEVFQVFAMLRLIDGSRNAWFETAAALHEFGIFLSRKPTPADLTDEKLTDFVNWYVGNPKVPTQPRSKRVALLRVDRLLTLWRFAANARYVDRLPKITGRPRHYAGEERIDLTDERTWEDATGD